MLNIWLERCLDTPLLKVFKLKEGGNTDNQCLFQNLLVHSEFGQHSDELEQRVMCSEIKEVVEACS